MKILKRKLKKGINKLIYKPKLIWIKFTWYIFQPFGIIYMYFFKGIRFYKLSEKKQKSKEPEYKIEIFESDL